MSVEAATTPVRAGFELDEASLLGWLRHAVPELADAQALTVRQFQIGRAHV